MSSVPLSVLDTVPVFTDHGPARALRDTVELAGAVERLGYHRYWVAEHHNSPGIAVSSPAVLLARLGAATSTLRLGSGGVMLPNHPPLVVAEQFNTLAALYPDRVDLGIGRAPGTDPMTALALRRVGTPAPDDAFAAQIRELLAYLRPEDDALLRAVPETGRPPAVWLLGSSPGSARLAGSLGLPLAFAYHFAAAAAAASIEEYRAAFRPSPWLAAAHVMVAVLAVVADTDERAHWLAGPVRAGIVYALGGRPGALVPEKTAAAQHYSDFEAAAVESGLAGQVIGDEKTARELLSALVARTGADEVIVTSPIHHVEDRLRCYELLAEVVGSLP
jgi:luciferase family oxidoreductase group 1